MGEKIASERVSQNDEEKRVRKEIVRRRTNSPPRFIRESDQPDGPPWAKYFVPLISHLKARISLTLAMFQSCVYFSFFNSALAHILKNRESAGGMASKSRCTKIQATPLSPRWSPSVSGLVVPGPSNLSLSRLLQSPRPFFSFPFYTFLY